MNLTLKITTSSDQAAADKDIADGKFVVVPNDEHLTVVRSGYSLYGSHRHYLCGSSDNEGCTLDTCAEAGKTVFTEWSSSTALPTTEGKYYLSGNVTLSERPVIKENVTLCLNGYTVSIASGKAANIWVDGGKLTITDCQGTGKLKGPGKELVGVDIRNSAGALNLYGGEVSGSVCDSTFDESIIKLSSSSVGSKAVFNMYGGKVQNSNSNNSCSAVFVTSDDACQINIYGGEVTCDKGDGIKAWNSGDAPVLITGGTVSGGNAALSVLGNLTLSGSPTLKHTNEGGADVRITTTNVAETENDHITVSDDFAPAEGTKVSVKKSVDSSGSVVFAAPAEGNNSLSSKAQHFVSAKEGYFVESNSNGDLQLTACAITGQPTAGNSYTVTANGGDKVTYQWYSVTKDDVPVTRKNATTKDFSSGWDVGEWSYVRRAENSESVTLTAFALHMNAGDKLKLTEAMGVEGFSLADSNNKPVNPVESSRMSCTYAAPADGEYTLTVMAMPRGEYLMPSFTATVTADVPDLALDGQTAATLNTTGLPSGSYICKVTWENKTTLNSQTVRYAAASSHVHSWSSEWTSDATHHWHKCETANCPVTENSGKDGYGPHGGGTATCQAKAVCVTCGTAYGDLDANGHDWGAWAVTTPATTSAAGVETRTCKRNASHTETRDIPKLTPAPSGGGSSSGSSGGSSSAPAITVPVSGSGDTVHVSASVSGSTAEVKEIKRTELDKIGTDSAVVIDLSGLNKGVTGVTLSTDTIDSIYKTEADGVTIKLPGAELRVDRRTLAAVTEQAAGSKIRLVVEPDSTARGTMTAAQKSTLAGMKNAAALEAYFVSNDTRIHDFKGGNVELNIPYRADGAIRAWFLKEDGTREPVSARYDKENALLILHHFSHYVIEELDSSAAYTVCAKDDSCPLGAFGDLTAAAWYHDGVHYCLENGLMRGVSGGKFLPDGSTTRAQLVTILWRLEGSPETTGAVRFGDTAGGAWYTEAVRWAAGCGVVKGYDNGCFGPNDAVTREQMAAILYRYAQHKGYDVSAGKDTNILSFNDAFAVSEYAIPAMQWACGSGMVRGIAQKGGMFLVPGDTTTRAQAATLIMRFQSAFAKEP